jgi:hypothetical protein
VATLNVEYVLSGASDPTTGIQVDDFLSVFLNDEPIAERSICLGQVPLGSCAEAAPVRFRGSTGDRLTLEARDGNVCYSVGPIFLQKADASCLRQLTPRIAGPNCGQEPPRQTFFRETYTLP